MHAVRNVRNVIACQNGQNRTGTSSKQAITHGARCYSFLVCLAAAASAFNALRCSHNFVDSISTTTMPPLTHTAARNGAGGSSRAHDGFRPAGSTTTLY